MTEEDKKEYELTCILQPQLEGASLDSFKKEITDILTKFNGSINFKEEKKHDLAYPINKQGQGIYLISQISIGPEKIPDFSKELKLNKQILRHLISQMPLVKPKPERKRRKKPAESAERIQAGPPKSERFGGKEKVELNEIDEKLDEIIKEI
jgi:small subunit ribosomal protein S6